MSGHVGEAGNDSERSGERRSKVAMLCDRFRSDGIYVIWLLCLCNNILCYLQLESYYTNSDLILRADYAIRARTVTNGELLLVQPLRTLSTSALQPPTCRDARVAYEWLVVVIAQLKDDALDDSDFPHVYLALVDFCNILSVKSLLGSGRALHAYV